AAGRLLRRVQAAGAVGFGGYASFPACFMAARQGRPVILHEQNGYLGLANRKMAKQAAAIGLTFREVAGIPATTATQTLTGNPVRPAFIELHGKPYPSPNPDGAFKILVLGGSQGARVFSDILPAAIESLSAEQRARLDLVQQCRPEDIDDVRSAYERMGVAATLESFFDDIPARMSAAHLVISRAGASTVTEVLAAGRPAILVPYPFAADDHQTFNARAVESEGAGCILPTDDFTVETVAARLGDLLDNPSQLAPVAAKAAAAAVPDAASRLADLVEEAMPNAQGSKVGATS
ncbi:MAG: UDP-N-acetylglucosamine--N-acetylmuramyl-(pentapeptide) pyrophosphoryl-undecaprenol N-acetylglucosamine transferase, partial [Pseudomonadota bacterium]